MSEASRIEQLEAKVEALEGLVASLIELCDARASVAALTSKRVDNLVDFVLNRNGAAKAEEVVV